MSKFGDRVHVLRVKRGLTQAQLADEISRSTEKEIKRSAIGNYERGIREPDLDTIEAFADFFDVSIADLMGREENESINEKIHGVGEQLTTPSRSKEWKVLSEGFEKMEQQRYDEFMAIFNMLKATKPEYFNEGDDDNDPES